MNNTGKEKTATNTSRGVQSIEVGLRILQAIASQGKSLPLKAISELAQMPPSNVHRYLASFVRSGLLKQSPESSRYELGWLALEIGLSALSKLDVMELAPPELKKLVEKHSLLGLITVFAEQGPTIVRFQQCSPPITISLSLGSIIPTLRSASGRVYLAYLPEEMTRHIVERELQANIGYNVSEGTPRSMAEVRAQAEATREKFYSCTEVDISPGIYAFAAPILDSQGHAAATISLIGPHGQISHNHPAIEELVSTCKQLSKEMGYQG